MVTERKEGRINPASKIRLTNSILFGTHNWKPIPEAPQQEKFISPPTFTPADALYFGTLLVSGRSRNVLSQVGIVLSSEERADIQRGINDLKKLGVSLDEHFSKKDMPTTAKKVAAFAKLNTQERQAVLEGVDGIAIILAPLITLSDEDFGFWHRIAHNDFVRMLI